MKKKIVHFLTGIRSEYDILAPVISAVNAREELSAGVIVTGAHLGQIHGNSVRQIESDGFDIVARIDSLLASDGLTGRVKGAALQLNGMCDLFAREKPDFLVVMGDREEAMTGALAGVYHHIPVVHLGGGDHADDGNVDNPIRHAVSKIANLHMATTELSGKRLEALGEEKWRINVVGASGLDRLYSTPKLNRRELESMLGVEWNGAPFVVLLYHPTITDFTLAANHIAVITKILEEIGIQVAIMMPNSDPGNLAIVAELNAFTKRYSRAKLFTYLERLVFVNMLRHANALIGNSSAGILEAPSLGLPVVNIGKRQRGREHAGNVIFTSYDHAEIQQAITKSVCDEEYRKKVAEAPNPYGDGTASAKIANIIARTPIDQELMQKRFIM
ncbi:UDP-N-acetylglucosamine 2-epimerase [Roseibium sp. FZY0029]|uniref:UDP-N-acetylglucosamine 2-epimerase n=1 Tax=Roseibium sp. FZY0029 TaxID=3116647 RepID=UPI002EBA1B62|nr:UDP-N-acetylglucosamine 2-epimerase [Roseibium sp. FZY0029]